MADDHGEELRALQRVIETCRARAVDLDLPALSHILGRAESSLAAHSQRALLPSRIQRGPALSVPRGRLVRH